MQHAIEWGGKALTVAGADTVHTEGFTIPNSWSGGETEMTVSAFYEVGNAKVGGLLPTIFRAHAVSVAWAPALAPVKHVPVVDVGSGSAADFAKAGNISGKLVLVHSGVLKTWDDLFAEYSNAPPVIAAAVKGKARAVAFIATREHYILYRHTNSNEGEIDQIPQLLVAREDGERIGRLLASGHPVWADLSIPNQIGGPIKSANVIAEIRGREKPDEYVVVGAHLDSWELGTGALDNGCNAALVIETARDVVATGIKPRRSIRFILYSGEEQGMLGSWAYVKAHKSEMDRIAGVVVIDEGMGRITGFSMGGRHDTEAALRTILKPIESWDIGEDTFDAMWGTDHFDYMLEGVPTLVANQEAANYMVNYHAASDTLDKVDIREVKMNAAIIGITAFGIAESVERFGPRQTRAEIETMLKESGLQQQLEMVGVWKQWQSGARGRQQ